MFNVQHEEEHVTVDPNKLDLEFGLGQKTLTLRKYLYGEVTHQDLMEPKPMVDMYAI